MSKHERLVEQFYSLPYGLWRCADQREVLFDRSYHPIWQRRACGIASEMKQWENVDWVRQFFFYATDADWATTIPKLQAALDNFKNGRSIERWIVAEQSSLKIPPRPRLLAQNGVATPFSKAR
jgi:hypothetical protein